MSDIAIGGSSVREGRELSIFDKGKSNLRVTDISAPVGSHLDLPLTGFNLFAYGLDLGSIVLHDLGCIVPAFEISIFGSGLSVAHAGFAGGYLSDAGSFR